MERLRYDLFDNVCYLLLRCTAFFILQPMFISTKWEIKPRAAEKMRSYVPRLSRTAIAAGQFFKEFREVCAVCSGGCCRGVHDRFTVFDHITNLVCKDRQDHHWGYYLMPVRSMNVNMAKMNEYCAYLGLDGCKLPYPERPTICVCGICSGIRKVMTKDQKTVLSDIRRTFYKVQFLYVLRLLFGGMRLVKDAHSLDGVRPNKFLDNRKLQNSKEIR